MATVWAALSLVGTSLLAPAPAMADVVDRVVLRVNDRIATLLDYERRRAEAISQISGMDLDQEERQERMANLGDRLFRDMFEELLMLSRADQLRIHPTEEEVDRALRSVRESFGIESEDEFAAALSSQGMSLAEFREQVRDQLRMRQVVAQEVTAQIELEEDDLRRIYRADRERWRTPARFRVRELIVLEAEDRDPEEVRATAEEIHDELESGRAFDEVAEVYAERGLTSDLVELGWMTSGELDPTLETAVASLDPGEFTEPVPARGGLHIVQLMEREEAQVRPFSEVAEQLEAQERQRLVGERLEDYMRELEEAAYVRAEPPPEAAGFRTVAGSRDAQDPFAGFDPVEGEESEDPDVEQPESPLELERTAPAPPPPPR
ncbi:MAG: peptidyl-prolyl cis-trans isomerase [Thermoanaerobaculia bacterium]